MSGADLKILDNTCTVWELQRDYGINKQKICRAIRSGKLNGFMLGIDEYVELKWCIKRDEKLDEWLRNNKQ